MIWGLPPHLLRPVHHFHEFFLSILEALVEEGAGFPHQVPDHIVVEEAASRGGKWGEQDMPAPPGTPLGGLGVLSPFIGGQDEI